MMLSTYMAEHGLTDDAFGRLIGVTPQAVARYRTGQRTPRPAVMIRIRGVTGGKVMADDFVLAAAERAA